MADQLGAVTLADVKKLRHMLGATECYTVREWGFRNYYATSGGDAMEAMKRLVAAGLATEGQHSKTMTYYHATEQGCDLIGFTKAQKKRAFEE